MKLKINILKIFNFNWLIINLIQIVYSFWILAKTVIPLKFKLFSMIYLFLYFYEKPSKNRAYIVTKRFSEFLFSSCCWYSCCDASWIRSWETNSQSGVLCDCFQAFAWTYSAKIMGRQFVDFARQQRSISLIVDALGKIN